MNTTNTNLLLEHEIDELEQYKLDQSEYEHKLKQYKLVLSARVLMSVFASFWLVVLMLNNQTTLALALLSAYGAGVLSNIKKPKIRE
jgi:hypothetical protein